MDRNLAKNFGHAKGLYGKIQEQVAAGKQAKAQGKVAEVAAARAGLEPLVKEMEALMGEYEAAAADIGEAALKNARNFDKIDKAMKGMAEVVKAGRAGLAALS